MLLLSQQRDDTKTNVNDMTTNNETNNETNVATQTRVIATNNATFTIANLSRELKINAKIARQRMRKYRAKHVDTYATIHATNDMHVHVYHFDKLRDVARVIVAHNDVSKIDFKQIEKSLRAKQQ